METRRPLELDPRLPFGCLENTGNFVRKPIVMRDVVPGERTCHQTRQSSRPGKNDTETRAFFFRKVAEALTRDCLRLLGKVRAH